MVKIHMNAPYRILKERIKDPLLDRIHPEIYFDWRSLEEDIKEAEKIASILREKDREITFHAPFMDINIGAVDPLIKDVTIKRITSLIPFVDIFSPSIVVIHGGYDPVRYDFDAGIWYDAARSSMDVILKAFDGKVTIAIENVFDRNPHPIWSLLDYYRGERIGFCFDPGHAFFLGNVPVTYWFEVLKDFLVEVHLHDNHGKSDEHLPIGEGLIDYKALFHLFKSLDNEPVYTLEVHREEHVERAIKSFERYYREGEEDIHRLQAGV